MLRIGSSAEHPRSHSIHSVGRICGAEYLQEFGSFSVEFICRRAPYPVTIDATATVQITKKTQKTRVCVSYVRIPLVGA